MKWILWGLAAIFCLAFVNNRLHIFDHAGAELLVFGAVLLFAIVFFIKKALGL